VAGDDAARAVDQDRIDKAKFLDTGSNLLDLFGRVGARIAVTRLKPGWVSIGYTEGGHGSNLVGLQNLCLITIAL
jgi:hypothetical protein